jgi:tryptophan synthase alpha chain|tara:strand:- start:26 stop:811 length:786 start_codon:yes stop_codon:yes gene_type:complete
LKRIEKKLKELSQDNQKAFVGYIVAGDPDLETSLQLMHLSVDSGVDILEIGVPFTDPIAEGPTIQQAHDRSLENETNLQKIIDLICKFREKDTNTPIILMGYINNFLMYKDLINRSHELGVDGVLVVDIPGELSLEDYGIDNQDLDIISLVSPTTSKERVKEIVKNSTGFIYYVTLRGVTGSSNLDGNEIEQNIKYIKSISSIPVMAGFGIKNSDDAKLLSSFSDGIVIGSSIVELIYKNSENKDFHEVSDYISNMKDAIR